MPFYIILHNLCFHGDMEMDESSKSGRHRLPSGKTMSFLNFSISIRDCMSRSQLRAESLHRRSLTHSLNVRQLIEAMSLEMCLVNKVEY